MFFDDHSYQKNLVKFSCPWEKGRQCFETRWYTDTTAYKTSTFYNFRNGHCFSINHRSVLDLVRPYEVYRFDFAQVSVPKDVCLQICLYLPLKIDNGSSAQILASFLPLMGFLLEKDNVFWWPFIPKQFGKVVLSLRKRRSMLWNAVVIRYNHCLQTSTLTTFATNTASPSTIAPF